MPTTHPIISIRTFVDPRCLLSKFAFAFSFVVVRCCSLLLILTLERTASFCNFSSADRPG